MKNGENDIRNSLAAYCSQAERCLDDVRKKMKTAGLPDDAEKRIIDYLIEEKFVDEARYSRSFVNDKFRFNRWGRLKIVHELRTKGVAPEIYGEALNSIDEDEYLLALNELIAAKRRTVKGGSPYEISQKLFRFAVSRGFEPSLIAAVLKDIEYEE